MKKISNLIYFLITFALLVTIDFYLTDMLYQKIISDWSFSSDLINITYAQNTGAAFSIMQNSKLFLVLTGAFAFVLIFMYVFRNLASVSKKGLLMLAFLAAGIWGNLSQRIELGYVKDFFELSFCNFPIFNISDIFITTGVIGIIIVILFSKRNIKFL